MIAFSELLRKVEHGENLTREESRVALNELVDGSRPNREVAAFLGALHKKGETAAEIAGFAGAMRERAVAVPIHGIRALDICGTGGDCKGSFNISTAAAFVLAACQIPVAKHGNRASSSQCGSADLLHAMRIRYRITPEEAVESLHQFHFAFLFAPYYHPATKSVAPVRKTLGFPTIFNLLGPLINPARPAVQLIGVYDGTVLPRMAEAIGILDPEKNALLVHGEGGWDEATPAGPFVCHPAKGHPLKRSASDFGFQPCSAEDLRGGNAEENAAIVLTVLHGKRGPQRDTVLLNALLGYRLYHADSDNSTAMAALELAIDSGAALHVVEQLQRRFPEDAQLL
jgi:anthranilate phosphoribosyltransferase